MDEITIPFHLFIPAVICVVALGFVVYCRRVLFARYKMLSIGVTAFLIVYLFIVGSATCYDIYYQWDLNRYDLDHDGMFGGAEITIEQQAAEQRLTSDVGRNFAFVGGLVYAFVASIAVIILELVISRLIRIRKR